MDSNASIVQNQVQGNDEHHPNNVDPQQVVHVEEKQPQEVKSVFNKVKAKAKKIKDSIKKHGQNVLDHGHGHDSEDHSEDQQVHEIHETEAVRSAAPASEKVENLEKSEVNFEGTKVEVEETDQKPRVVDVFPTTEIEQNITTDQGKTFVGEEKSEQPNAYLEEDPLKYNQTKPTDLNETGAAEIDIAPVEKSFERLNVQDEKENVTETKSPSAGTGSLNQFVPEPQVQEEEPHQEPQVVDVNPTTGINQNITTDQDKTFVYEENSDQPNEYFKEDSHGSGSRDESYTPPQSHQTKVTDLTGPADTEEIGITTVEKFFVQDELKHRPEPNVFPNVTETQSVPEISSPTKTENPSAEIHDQFVQDFSTAAKTQDPSDGSHDQFDPETISTGTNRDHEISEATEQTFNSNNTTIKVEEQPSYESVEKPSNVSKTDKTHESDYGSNKSGSTAEYGENIDQSLTEKLGPDYGKVAEVGTGTGAETEDEVKEEKKGVSSVKDSLADYEENDEKPEKVSEESSVQSPGKGYVDKLKGVVGSWFATKGEDQSTQGDEVLPKNEKSGVEVEQVNKAEG
ncbi:PREDICTED: low-temperature-induced 65 kDa protein-like isoform X1 [Lupinus angustifolius]|uniref:low-temperature-induced 65 kDa protein-like isoform X1 n=1 Tax=Lupinus angustifolius TaxID=3871 RepID=UPI00092E532D|nr:PREDICTED: low-temperature-induced 65 kDa protein-like isoform X1 [Lupinus angustifolius]